WQTQRQCWDLGSQTAVANVGGGFGASGPVATLGGVATVAVVTGLGGSLREKDDSGGERHEDVPFFWFFFME
ncbi:hypothetical protein Ancab_008792, partial [Ancistrocladus abbreviatus]